MFLPHPRVKVSIAGSLRDREVACSASDRQGSNFEFCVWRTVSFQSSHNPEEVLLAQFSLYAHKGGLKPDSFHFIFSLSASHTRQIARGPRAHIPVPRGYAPPPAIVSTALVQRSVWLNISIVHSTISNFNINTHFIPKKCDLNC